MNRLYTLVFKEYWNPYLTVGLAGLLSALYFGLTGTVWAVTGEFTRFGGHLLKLFFNIDVSNWAYFKLIHMSGTPIDRTDGWIVIGMVVGALITVLLSSSFKIRIPRQKRRLLQGFAGGIVAGFGARLAMGCNLAAFFTGVPQFSFHAWIFMVATAIGTYAGVQIVQRPWWIGKPDLKSVSAKTVAAENNARTAATKSRSIQPILGAAVALVFAVLVIMYYLQGKGLLGSAALMGVGFGVLIERGQICFTSAFRDLWISGRAVMAKAIALGMIVSVIVTFVFIQTGTPALIKVAAPSTLLGGFLFGLGIVLAGGCETGMMYRAMEGQLVYWFVGLGNILGATLLAYGWDHLGIYNALAKGWQPINLIKVWGSPGALIGTLAFLLLVYLLTNWWEKHYRYGKGLQVGDAELVPSQMNG
ncbi:MAG: YeeE/YedE family protein [Bacilli bacterium]|nr:YeeE/YedE family protein [Bacilli bacterium]